MPNDRVVWESLLGCAICIVLACSAGRIANGDEDFPYTAYVKSRHQANVYSGPGTEFYTTDRLDAGTEVEVYKHLHDDWAAIRPPAGSFSLVPVSALHVSGNNDLGTVAEQVKTIVGSRLGQGRHDVEYVTLPPGEVVQILGSTELALEDGQDLMCYEIVPPAGEFRWVRTRDISSESASAASDADPRDIEATQRLSKQEHELINFEDDGVSLSAIHSSRAQPRYAARSDRPETHGIRLVQSTDESGGQTTPQLETTGPGERLPLLAAPEPAGDQDPSTSWNPATPLSIQSAGEPPSAVPDRAGSTTETPTRIDSFGLVAPPVRRPGEPATESDRESPPADIGLPNDAFSSQTVLPELRSSSDNPQPLELGPIGKLRLGQELIDIELQLTQQVCQSPATWHLSDLRTRAQAVIDASNDPRQRATAQNIIAKIAQFEDVRRRQKTIVALNFDRNAPRSRLVSRDTAGPSEYDGTGFLMPVVTQDPNIPKYVLTDEEGNIIQFVSPKPGISLKRFEQQRVGILGERSYLPTYNQPHLMAERIITLQKTR